MNPGSSQFASQFPDAEETMSKMESNGLQTKESIQKHSKFLTSAATATRAILQKRIDTTRAAIAKAEGVEHV